MKNNLNPTANLKTNKMKKIALPVLFFIMLTGLLKGQNVGINTPTPAASSILDLTSNNRGLLIPRLTTASRTSISSPAFGLLVCDTTLNAFYFWDKTAWRPFLSDFSGWKTTGNSGTNPAVNFLGTTDNQPLKLKVNNQPAGSIQTDGQTFIGLYAGMNTTGTNNTAFGNSALKANTTGIDNTASGSKALFLNTTGSFNSAYGYYSLNSNTTGTSNAAFGFSSLSTNTTGASNAAFGASTLDANTTGFGNTALGNSALFANTIGYDNTATGNNALGSNTTGFENVAVGAHALANNLPVSITTGNRNTGVGHSALKFNTTGSGNSALGFNAGTLITATNSTAIGNCATANASNKIRLGDGNVTVIEGQVAYSYPSDARFKINVKNNIPGLDFIMQLKPVTYNFDTKKFEEHILQDMPDGIKAERLNDNDFTSSTKIIHSGFLAQDIEQACKQSGYDFDGLHIPDSTNKTDHYSVAYSQFIMPLVKGMQEQQSIINQQTKTISELLSRIEKLESSNK